MDKPLDDLVQIIWKESHVEDRPSTCCMKVKKKKKKKLWYQNLVSNTKFICH